MIGSSKRILTRPSSRQTTNKRAITEIEMFKGMDNLSQAVSHALRHEPWLYELELDEEGWADIGALLTALRQESPAWSDLTEPDLADMIRASSKQRHELVNGRIRALYGHSLPGKLHRTPAKPPAQLFHGRLKG